MTHAEMHALAALLRTRLDHGTIHAMDALRAIQPLKFAGGQQAALADLLKETVKTWHDAYAAKMARTY